MHRKTSTKNIHIGRLEAGDDLLQSLNGLCARHRITFGSFTLIGAVKNAVMGYFDQRTKRYTASIRMDNDLEIASCMGNISFRDGKPFVHAHIVFSDVKGKAFGGHLMSGTIVYAAEYCIWSFTGKAPARKLDPVTNLPLW